MKTSCCSGRRETSFSCACVPFLPSKPPCSPWPRATRGTAEDRRAACARVRSPARPRRCRPPAPALGHGLPPLTRPRSSPRPRPPAKAAAKVVRAPSAGSASITGRITPRNPALRSAAARVRAGPAPRVRQGSNARSRSTSTPRWSRRGRTTSERRKSGSTNPTGAMRRLAAKHMYAPLCTRRSIPHRPRSTRHRRPRATMRRRRRPMLRRRRRHAISTRRPPPPVYSHAPAWSHAPPSPQQAYAAPAARSVLHLSGRRARRERLPDPARQALGQGLVLGGQPIAGIPGSVSRMCGVEGSSSIFFAELGDQHPHELAHPPERPVLYTAAIKLPSGRRRGRRNGPEPSAGRIRAGVSRTSSSPCRVTAAGGKVRLPGRRCENTARVEKRRSRPRRAARMRASSSPTAKGLLMKSSAPRSRASIFSLSRSRAETAPGSASPTTADARDHSPCRPCRAGRDRAPPRHTPRRPDIGQSLAAGLGGRHRIARQRQAGFRARRISCSSSTSRKCAAPGRYSR